MLVCRSTCATSGRLAPARSSSLAAQCRSRCALADTPDRCAARDTIPDTAFPVRSPCGAITLVNTRVEVHRSGLCRSQPAIASPTSVGSGSTSSRPPLPRTRNLAVAPVHVAQFERGHLANPQPEPYQQCEHREVPAPHRGSMIAGCDRRRYFRLSIKVFLERRFGGRGKPNGLDHSNANEIASISTALVN